MTYQELLNSVDRERLEYCIKKSLIGIRDRFIHFEPETYSSVFDNREIQNCWHYSTKEKNDTNIDTSIPFAFQKIISLAICNCINYLIIEKEFKIPPDDFISIEELERINKLYPPSGI